MIAIGLGAPVEMMLALLLLTELLVGAVAFAVINRRGWSTRPIWPSAGPAQPWR